MNAPTICPECGKYPVCAKATKYVELCFRCGAERLDRVHHNRTRDALAAWKKNQQPAAEK